MINRGQLSHKRGGGVDKKRKKTAELRKGKNCVCSFHFFPFSVRGMVLLKVSANFSELDFFGGRHFALETKYLVLLFHRK